jgi:hypothetical protein
MGEDDEEIKALATEARGAIIQYATDDWIQHSPFLVRGLESRIRETIILKQQDGKRHGTELTTQTSTVEPAGMCAHTQVEETIVDTPENDLKLRARFCVHTSVSLH